VKTYRADLTRDNDLQRIASWVKKDFGRLDILVHGAGVIALGPVQTAPFSDFCFQCRTNVRARTSFPRSCCATEAAKGRSSSEFQRGLQAHADVAQYAATKHGLRAIADGLREEVNVDGVRVLTVILGRTATPMQAAVHRHERRPYHPRNLIQPEDVATLIAETLALPRSVEVTEVSLRPLGNRSRARWIFARYSP